MEQNLGDVRLNGRLRRPDDYKARGEPILCQLAGDFSIQSICY